MSIIDPKRGTHFNGKKITVTDHAAERAVKRFGRKHSEAKRWISDNLRKSAYIGETVSDDGRQRIIYGYERIAFIVSKEDEAVITVYPQHQAEPTLREKVEAIIAKEMRKARRKLNRLVRDVELEKADLVVEKAVCQRRLVRTRSEAVRLAMQARINAIDEYIDQLDEDVSRAQQEKSTLAKGVVAYL